MESTLRDESHLGGFSPEYLCNFQKLLSLCTSYSILLRISEVQRLKGKAIAKSPGANNLIGSSWYPSLLARALKTIKTEISYFVRGRPKDGLSRQHL
jgi:hypothetical protein